MTKSTLQKILKVFLTLQWAKELPRQGFIALGFKRNEADSVAAHSWATAMLAYLLATELKRQGVKVDVDRTVKMALLHDMAETIVGDVHTHVKKMAGGAFREIERLGLLALVKDLPSKDEIVELMTDYEKRESFEARIVKACDNLDALAQAKSVPAAKIKYFKGVYNLTKFDWHRDAVEMILKDEVEPYTEWEKDSAKH